MTEPGTARQTYPALYAAEHGGFSVVPAAYVFLVEGDRVLLQLRANTGYYDGFWAASAAGHVEAGEPVTEAAVREASEELGISIAQSDLEALTGMHRTAPTGLAIDQRVDFFFACRSWSGTPALQEQKAADLRWFDLAGLPDNLVHHERFVLERWRDGTLAPITAFGF
ncbi:MAG TPA: NUDIX domain-containing protein [Agromyces sp.]|nr:NUDIX domain-containing protein [Agromyces sp.]